MHSGPSKAAEGIVAMLLPPACREEIVGDLHERFTFPPQYALDALRTVPLVVLSRIRCTLDLQILVIQAFALCISFWGAAWLADRAFFEHPCAAAGRDSTRYSSAWLHPRGRIQRHTCVRLPGTSPHRHLGCGSSALAAGIRVRHELRVGLGHPAVLPPCHEPTRPAAALNYRKGCTA